MKDSQTERSFTVCFDILYVQDHRISASYKSPHEREYNDSLGFWIPPCGFRIPGTGFQSLLVEFGFLIPIVNGILDSNFQDFGFNKQTFSGIRIPLHGTTQALEAKYYCQEILCITG